MFNVEVVKCSSRDHKVKCFNEAIGAVGRARHGNEKRNGRKVTIRGAITNPCTCHIDALISLATDITDSAIETPSQWLNALVWSAQRATRNEMR